MTLSTEMEHDENKQSSSKDYEEDQPPFHRSSPLDQGYAWVIAAFAGLSIFIGAGFVKAYTMVYEELLDRFGKSATTTALVGSLHSGIKMCSSPIVSALVNRFGSRCITITGGVISFVGFAMSAFPPNLYFLYFAHSIVAGPIVSALVNRFGSRCITITGGVISFVGFAMSAFPPNLYFLYFAHSIVAGIGTNMVHSNAFIMVGQYFVKRRGTALGLATSCAGLGGFSLSLILSYLFANIGYSSTLLIYSAITLHYIAVGMIYQPLPSKYLSDAEAKVETSKNKISLQDNSHYIYASTHSLDTPGVCGSQPKLTGVKENSHKSVQLHGDGDELKIRMLKRGLSAECAKSEQSMNLKENCDTVTLRNGVSTSVENGTTSTDTEGNKKTSVVSYLGLYLYKDVDFILLTMVMFGAFYGFSVGAFLMGLGSEILQLTRAQVAFTLSIACGCEVFARPVSGLVFDSKFVKPYRKELWLCFGILCGISIMILPFSNSYPMFFGVWVLHSMCAGCFHVQHIGIISDLVGSRNLSSAMGLIRFAMGAGILIGPTVGGLLKDTFDTYTYAFILNGFVIIFSCVLFKILHLCKVCAQSKANENK